jgi:hypothetical protein
MTTTMPLLPYRYWYLSLSADHAIDAAIAANPRRSWNPRREAPSLATLQGRAKLWSGKYRRSLAALMARTGYGTSTALAWCDVIAPRDAGGHGGRKVRLVWCPRVGLAGETVADTGAPGEILALASEVSHHGAGITP